MKDGTKVAEALLATNETTYRLGLFASALLTLVRSGMVETKTSVEHNPGQDLYIVNSLEKFKESEFSKTGSENQHETEAFFVKSNTQIHAAGSKRNLDLSLNWMMTRPAWNLRALKNGKASVDIKGHNPKWRNSYLSREFNWSIPNRSRVDWVSMVCKRFVWHSYTH